MITLLMLSGQNPPTTSKTYPFGLSYDEILSLKLTALMTGLALVFLGISLWQKSAIGVALSGGAIGGFLHEFVQSKGRVLFVKQQSDGLYLGSISGLILGMVAGLLVYAGTSTAVIPTVSTTNTLFSSYSIVQQNIASSTSLEFLAFQTMIAGLALKGVSEAATSPAKTEDDFSIISALIKKADNVFAVEIHLKNNLSSKLQLQLVSVSDSETLTFTQDVSQMIDGKSTGVIAITFGHGLGDAPYMITIISLNGTASANDVPSQVSSKLPI